MGNYAVAISWPDGLTQVSIPVFTAAFSRRQPEQPQILDFIVQKKVIDALIRLLRG